jgi:DNA-binding beta-propeller fold protein YncE
MTRHLPASLAALAAALFAASMSIGAQQPTAVAANCNGPMTKPVVDIAVSGVPMHPTVTRDGCWMFLGFVGANEVAGVPGGSGIDVRRRTGDTFQSVEAFPLSLPRGPLNGVPMGMALTSDEKVLVVSHSNQVTFFDVTKLQTGDRSAVMGHIEGPRISTSWGLALSPDDKYAFAAQQSTSAIAMIDMEKARSAVFDQTALTGIIGTSVSPINVVVSPDGRYLYTANRFTADTIPSQPKCAGIERDEGVIQIIDVQLAKVDPKKATISFASPAGCAPQNVAISPDGVRLSATAGGALIPTPPLADNSVVIFDTRPLAEGKLAALLGRIPMPAPPVIIEDTGTWIIVGFIFQTPPTDGSDRLLVIDPQKAAAGTAAIIGRLPVAAVQTTLSPDRRTLYATRRGALSVVDLGRVTLEPIRN